MAFVMPQQQQQQRSFNPPGTHTTEERPTTADRKRAAQFKITPEEFVRRDKIVRQLFIDTPYKVGEVLFPITLKDREKYDSITVRGIWKTYHDFPTAEAMDWPENDRPLIMTVQPRNNKEGQLVLCNHTWLFRPAL